MPQHLMKWEVVVNETTEQIKAEYIFISKKSVVDFVLGKSLDKIESSVAESSSQDSANRGKMENISPERLFDFFLEKSHSFR